MRESAVDIQPDIRCLEGGTLPVRTRFWKKGQGEVGGGGVFAESVLDSAFEVVFRKVLILY